MIFIAKGVWQQTAQMGIKEDDSLRLEWWNMLM